MKCLSQDFNLEILLRTSSTYQALRSCSGSLAKMLLKSLFGIKYHSQYIKRHQTSLAQFHQLMGMTRCIVRDLETIIVDVLLAFNFIP